MRTKTFNRVSFSKPQLIVFAIVFGLMGGYVIWRSFAASSTQTISLDSQAEFTTTSSQQGVDLLSKPGSVVLSHPDVAAKAVRHVLATQGPTDPNNLYVMVTWERSQPDAIAHEIFRNSVFMLTRTISGDAWDDMAYKDNSVQAGQTYAYQIRAVFKDGTKGPLSQAFDISIRSDVNIGGGKIYEVDKQIGSSDLAKAQAAVAAAKANGGGVVLFGPRTYVFSATLLVNGGSNIVFRGAGAEKTFLQPGFAGGTVPCADDGILIQFRGSSAALTPTLTKSIAVGDQTIEVNSTAGLAIGQVIRLYQPPIDQNGNLVSGSPKTLSTAGVIMDPGSGYDESNRWDANEIVGISGNRVTFRYPWSQSYSISGQQGMVSLAKIYNGDKNAIEGLTIQGRSSSEQTYYQAINLSDQTNFSIAGVTGRWVNRNYVKSTGYKLTVIGFLGADGDSKTDSWGDSCRYKFSIWRSANFSFIGGIMGSPSHNNNISFITTQRAQRSLVRSSVFYSNHSYAFNEHGGGSRHYIFENNYVSVGTAASKGGVFLGNSDIGYSGPGIIRNNTFENNYRDVSMQENSYEIRILDNIMRGASDRSITGYGWGGANTATDLYGSIRWMIARNQINAAKDGIVFGGASSPWFPYEGIRDIDIYNNAITGSGVAINLIGSQGLTSRFQVAGNTGTNNYIKPSFESGDYWHANADGGDYGSRRSVSWEPEYFPWELNESAISPLYTTSGSFEKQIDAGNVTDWQSINIDAVTPLSTTVMVQAQTSADSITWSNLTTIVCQGSNCPATSPLSSLAYQRYIKLKIILSGDGKQSPEIKSLSFTYANDASKIGDLNNDNAVNILDLSILLSKYGQTTNIGDLNNDGKVDVIDLSILINNYGS